MANRHGHRCTRTQTPHRDCAHKWTHRQLWEPTLKLRLLGRPNEAETARCAHMHTHTRTYTPAARACGRPRGSPLASPCWAAPAGRSSAACGCPPLAAAARARSARRRRAGVWLQPPRPRCSLRPPSPLALSCPSRRSVARAVTGCRGTETKTREALLAAVLSTPMATAKLLPSAATVDGDAPPAVSARARARNQGHTDKEAVPPRLNRVRATWRRMQEPQRHGRRCLGRSLTHAVTRRDPRSRHAAARMVQVIPSLGFQSVPSYVRAGHAVCDVCDQVSGLWHVPRLHTALSHRFVSRLESDSIASQCAVACGARCAQADVQRGGHIEPDVDLCWPCLERFRSTAAVTVPRRPDAAGAPCPACARTLAGRSPYTASRSGGHRTPGRGVHGA